MSDEKEFVVHLSAPASTFVKVTAVDYDEAIEKACNEVHIGLCHQCDREVDVSDVWEPVCVVDDETNGVVWEEV